jgi:hypothetical protein
VISISGFSASWPGVELDVFYSNGGAGVLIQPTGSASVQATITRTQFENNLSGIAADGTNSTGQVQVQIKDSVISENGTGVSALSGAGLITISLSNSHVSRSRTRSRPRSSARLRSVSTRGARWAPMKCAVLAPQPPLV